MVNIRDEHATFIAKALRVHPCVLSDEDFKELGEGLDPKEIVAKIKEHGGPFNENELRMLVKAIGEMSDKHHFEKYGDDWTDDVLEGYADHIYNYLYNYKDEAKDIDPTIDTKEDHIGPMAQDIEKVNPACIKETEDGVKEVDTGRLALMNAGAIAQLARDMREVKKNG